MRILIVEDEPGVAQNLSDLLHEVEPDIEILSIQESVEETIRWIKENDDPDIGFFDIRLADGNSFEIFDHVEVTFPVIFTTAFDEFALKAFKVNSIDYLLKPIDKNEMESALQKYRNIYQRGIDQERLQAVIDTFSLNHSGKYKKNLLVYAGEKIIPVDLGSIAFFQLKDELVYGFTHMGKKYHIDQSLEKVMNQINPEDFYRANRQFIISRKAVISASQHFNRKLVLNINPNPDIEVLISKSRVTEFKKWLSG